MTQRRPLDAKKCQFLGMALLAMTIGGACLPTSVMAQDTTRCGEVPQVMWWGNTSHEKMIAYTKKRHQGDWEPYIAKWENYLHKMQKGLAEGKSAHIPKTGAKLKGRELGDYVQKIEARVKVMRCLEQVLMKSTEPAATAKDDDPFADGLNMLDKAEKTDAPTRPEKVADNNALPLQPASGEGTPPQAPAQRMEYAPPAAESNMEKRQRKQLFFRKLN